MKRLAKVFTTVVNLRRAASLVCVVSLLVSIAGLHLTNVSAALPSVAAETSSVQREATAKRALTHQDYDSWRSIQAPQISRDGKFVAYAFLPQDGDGEVI